MRTLLFIFLIIPVTPSVGQQKVKVKEYVLHNTVRLSTISPDSTNYGDLSIIGHSIGNAQIVMLGEQDHGDAATFLAKTRLVKYLHEKKGFNILAFESDFFGLNNGWDNLDKNQLQIDSLIRNNILSLWTYCDACQDLLYGYIPTTQKSSVPIIITGFDNQTVYTYSRNYLIEKLDSVLRKLEIPIVQSANYHSELLPQLHTLVTKFGYQIPTQDFFRDCGNTLNIIKEQVRSKIPDHSFWSMVIDNLIAFNREEYNFKQDKWKAETIRDKQMALNLKWIIQSKYPHQKVIVWAANNHVSNYSSKNYASMRQYFSSDTSLNDKIYSIGFTSYEGEGGRLWQKKFTIHKSPRNSLEGWMSDSYDYAFIDFTAYNNTFPKSNERFIMRGWGYRSFKTQWNQLFDGIFYIKRMYPCADIKTAAYIGLQQAAIH